MQTRPVETTAPSGSRIASLLPGASFHDAWSVESDAVALGALDHFIAVARQTPGWVDRCMRLRNRVGGLVGLKNLGTLSGIEAGKPGSAYLPGERVGIFTVFENGFDEALIGDRDKHLDVVLGVHRRAGAEPGRVVVTVTTVVHVKNLLGRLYMLPVRPMHRVIVQAVLRAMPRTAAA